VDLEGEVEGGGAGAGSNFFARMVKQKLMLDYGTDMIP
jgi:hypothetical protein